MGTVSDTQRKYRRATPNAIAAVIFNALEDQPFSHSCVPWPSLLKSKDEDDIETVAYWRKVAAKLIAKFIPEPRLHPDTEKGEVTE